MRSPIPLPPYFYRRPWFSFHSNQSPWHCCASNPWWCHRHPDWSFGVQCYTTLYSQHHLQKSSAARTRLFFRARLTDLWCFWGPREGPGCPLPLLLISFWFPQAFPVNPDPQLHVPASLRPLRPYWATPADLKGQNRAWLPFFKDFDFVDPFFIEKCLFLFFWRFLMNLIYEISWESYMNKMNLFFRF